MSKLTQILTAVEHCSPVFIRAARSRQQARYLLSFGEMPPLLRQLAFRQCNGTAFNLSGLLRSLPPVAESLQFLQPALTSSFTTSAPLQAKAKKKKRKPRRPSNIADQYRQVQAQARKEANIAKQEVLKKERAAALGDPVLSQPTPFIESLRSLQPPPEPALKPRNFLLTPDTYIKSLQNSERLAAPLKINVDSKADEEARRQADAEYTKQLQEHQADHAHAAEALDRITSFEHGSSKDRTRLNIQRCIEEFGRHRTDDTLPPRPCGPAQEATPPPPFPRVRAGPDTGSSEVQVAILTTKIDKLAEHTRIWGHKDKHNKRNLRLLVHRRQKLLKHLRKRERGGPRFQHVMEKLGLGDATWVGEISM